MSLFYFGAIFLVILGLIFALWPFFAVKLFGEESNLASVIEREDVNVSLYTDHLKDIEQSLAHGNITQDQFDVLKLELERNLLEDSVSENGILEGSASKDDVGTAADATSSDVKSKSEKAPSVYVLVSIVFIPVLAFLLYQSLGSFDSVGLQASLAEKFKLEQAVMSNPESIQSKRQLETLTSGLIYDLDKHLLKRPEDLDSRVLLARTAVEVGEYDKAIAAYQFILEKEPQSSQIMAELGQTVFLKAGNQVVPVVSMLAERALGIEPNNVIALGLMGINNFQRGQYQQAISFWEKAVAIYPPNSANGLALQSGIVEAQARLATQPASIPSEKSQSDAQDQKTKQETASSPKIKVAVTIAESVPAKSEYTVFIYARAWQGAKLPLAITKVTASQLPITVELNDSMNMAPGLNLSSAQQVEVIARLSPSGNAITQPDDWLASIGPIDPLTASTTVYPLEINRSVSE